MTNSSSRAEALSTGRRCGRVAKLLGATMLVLMIFVCTSVIPNIQTGRRSHHECALCRARTTHTVNIGIDERVVKENDFSRWYAREVEPVHDHLWLKLPSTGLLNMYGGVVGVADSSHGRGDIVLLTPDVSLEIWKHVDLIDRPNLRRTFAELDENDGDYIRFVVGVLRGWQRHGFVQPWDEIFAELEAEKSARTAQRSSSRGP